MVLKDEIDKCLQCTIVGDSLVGKSTLVQKFSREGREKKLEYEHTIFENAAGMLPIKHIYKENIPPIYHINLFNSDYKFVNFHLSIFLNFTRKV